MHPKGKALRWHNLTSVWQTAFEQAWLAWKNGSVPIGAVITDANGEIVSLARNHIHDKSSDIVEISENKLAHAELNALIKLKNKFSDFHDYHLYTTCEPCPLCMSAVYMSGIRNLTYAAHDYYAGSTNLLGTTPYLKRKPVETFFTGNQQFENVLLGLQTVFMLERGDRPGYVVLQTWQSHLEKAVKLGNYMFEEKILINEFFSKSSTEEIFNKLCEIEELFDEVLL